MSECKSECVFNSNDECWLVCKNKFYQQGRADAIDEYSDKLFKAIEMATINCKLDITIEDLRNIEIIIKGLAEQLKEQNNGRK